MGDRVDAYDKYNTWNTGTISWTDTRVPGAIDCKMPMCRVGFREYQENGDKRDELGAYFGYSNAMDEYIGVWSTRI